MVAVVLLGAVPERAPVRGGCGGDVMIIVKPGPNSFSGLSQTSIRRILDANKSAGPGGVNQKHIHPSVELITCTCKQCGKEFKLSYAQAAQRSTELCSRYCSSKWVNAQRFGK
jgi:hypothetical protein